MTTAPYPQVTDELLSAYIDEAVSEDERRLIESAVAHDPHIAWRLESLRATVRLLHELPALALPRSFVLAPEQVNGAASQPVRAAAASVAPNGAPARREANQRRQEEAGAGDSFWQALWRGWGRFWQAGSPALRNAMAASFAVLLALLIVPRFLAPPALPSVGSVQNAAAPAGESAAVMSSAEAGNPGAQSDQMAAAVAPTLAVQVEPDAGTARQAPGSAQPEAATETGASAKLANTDAAVPGSEPASEPSGVAASAAAESGAESGADTGTFAVPAGAAAAPADAALAAPAPEVPALAAPAPGQPAPVLEEGAPVMEGAASGGRSAIDDMQMAGGGGGAPQAPEAAPPGAAAAQPVVPDSARTVAPEAEAAVQASAADAAPPAPAQVAAVQVEAVPQEETAATPALDAAPPIAASQPVEAQSAPAEAADTAAPVTSATEPALAAGLALALPVLALLAAAATLVFAVLWWRSRAAH